MAWPKKSKINTAEREPVRLASLNIPPPPKFGQLELSSSHPSKPEESSVALQTDQVEASAKINTETAGLRLSRWTERINQHSVDDREDGSSNKEATAQTKKDFPKRQSTIAWSEPGSNTRPSSSIAEAATPGDEIWQFGDIEPLDSLSSPAATTGNLPDASPLPSLRNRKAEGERGIDFSETATTTWRSSPFGLSEGPSTQSWDFNETSSIAKHNPNSDIPSTLPLSIPGVSTGHQDTNRNSESPVSVLPLRKELLKDHATIEESKKQGLNQYDAVTETDGLSIDHDFHAASDDDFVPSTEPKLILNAKPEETSSKVIGSPQKTLISSPDASPADPPQYQNTRKHKHHTNTMLRLPPDTQQHPNPSKFQEQELAENDEELVNSNSKLKASKISTQKKTKQRAKPALPLNEKANVIGSAELRTKLNPSPARMPIVVALLARTGVSPPNSDRTRNRTKGLYPKKKKMGGLVLKSNQKPKKQPHPTTPKPKCSDVNLQANGYPTSKLLQKTLLNGRESNTPNSTPSNIAQFDNSNLKTKDRTDVFIDSSEISSSDIDGQGNTSTVSSKFRPGRISSGDSGDSADMPLSQSAVHAREEATGIACLRSIKPAQKTIGSDCSEIKKIAKTFGVTHSGSTDTANKLDHKKDDAGGRNIYERNKQVQIIPSKSADTVSEARPRLEGLASQVKDKDSSHQVKNVNIRTTKGHMLLQTAETPDRDESQDAKIHAKDGTLSSAQRDQDVEDSNSRHQKSCTRHNKSDHQPRIATIRPPIQDAGVRVSTTKNKPSSQSSRRQFCVSESGSPVNLHLDEVPVLLAAQMGNEPHSSRPRRNLLAPAIILNEAVKRATTTDNVASSTKRFKMAKQDAGPTKKGNARKESNSAPDPSIKSSNNLREQLLSDFQNHGQSLHQPCTKRSMDFRDVREPGPNQMKARLGQVMDIAIDYLSEKALSLNHVPDTLQKNSKECLGRIENRFHQERTRLLKACGEDRARFRDMLEESLSYLDGKMREHEQVARTLGNRLANRRNSHSTGIQRLEQIHGSIVQSSNHSRLH